MVAIDNYKISPNRKVIDDLDIQIIYIPLISKLGYPYRPKVKVGEYVCIGTVLGESTAIDFPLLSTVSGTVVGLEDKYIANNKLVKCIVIENDFKDKYLNKPGSKRNINNLNKEEFLYALSRCGITDMSGSDYPVYLKYMEDTKFKYLVIDATYYEVLKSSDSALLYNNVEEILEVMDAIMDIMKIKKGYIAISEDNSLVIKRVLKHINTYPNIKIYPAINAFPSGHSKCLIRDILDISYKKYPSDAGIVYENVATIYAIYEALKYDKPVTERIISLSGKGIKNPCNYKVRIGTNLDELLEKTDNYKKINNPILVVNGLMMGTAINDKNLIITKDVHTISIVENKVDNVSECIKCGKCSEVCPVNLIPSLIIKTKDKKNRPDKCIECGLCSYVCPAKIDIREIIKSIKDDKNE